MLLDGPFFFNLTPRKEVLKGILIPPKKGGKSAPKNHLHFAGASFTNLRNWPFSSRQISKWPGSVSWLLKPVHLVTFNLPETYSNFSPQKSSVYASTFPWTKHQNSRSAMICRQKSSKRHSPMVSMWTSVEVRRIFNKPYCSKLDTLWEAVYAPNTHSKTTWSIREKHHPSHGYSGSPSRPLQR